MKKYTSAFFAALLFALLLFGLTVVRHGDLQGESGSQGDFLLMDNAEKEEGRGIERNQIHPDDQNVFFIPDVYASAGETFEIHLQLRGRIDLCAFDIRICYDSALLRYAGSDDDDERLLINCVPKEGVLYINYVQLTNLEQETDLCSLAFQVMTSDIHKTPLRIEVAEAVGIDSDGEINRRDCTPVDGILYLNWH